jgi:hypothetical protein
MDSETDKTLRELKDIYRCLRGLRDVQITGERQTAEGMRDWYTAQIDKLSGRLQIIIQAAVLVNRLFGGR